MQKVGLQRWIVIWSLRLNPGVRAGEVAARRGGSGVRRREQRSGPHPFLKLQHLDWVKQ